MDNTQIERNGITAFENFLSKSQLLVSEISKGDKYPLWDGEILVYSNPEHNNENLKGRIPVQVKSNLVTEFKNSKKTFSFEKHELENYSRDGGIILIRPIFISTVEYEIYYKLLLPRDISLLIKEIKPDKNSITFKLSKVNEVKEFETLCKHFLENKTQLIKNSIGNDISELIKISDKIVVKTIAHPSDKFPNPLFSDLAYLYIETKDGNIIPTELQFKKISQYIEDPVIINGKEYFRGININTDGNNKQLFFNSAFYIKFNKDDRLTFKLESHDKVLFNHYIEAVEFLLIFKETQSFYIGKNLISGRVENFNISKTFSKDIKYLLKINSLFNLFRVNSSKITLKDIYDSKSILDELVKLFIDELPIENEKENRSYFFKIYELINRKIIVLLKRNENGSYLGINLYSDKEKTEFCIQDEISIELIPCSPFLALLSHANFNVEHIDIFNNFLDIIEKDLINFYNPKINHIYNQIILLIISGYDLTKNIDFLKLANEINELSNFEKQAFNNPIYFINRMQIKKRTINLENDEIKNLLNLKDKFPKDKNLLCCINILIESYMEFEILFDSLNDVDKDIFKTWPIWTLYLQR